MRTGTTTVQLLLGMAFCTCCLCGDSVAWQQWIADFGHDTFQYPAWIKKQMQECRCTRHTGSIVCLEKGERVIMREDSELTFCTAKDYLLKRMPKFDQGYLPPAVTVDGASMFDDNIAFALMADKAAPYAAPIPLGVKLAYVLPYGSFHEPRNNWRPLFFAKYFNITAEQTTTVAAMQALVNESKFLDWSGNAPMADTAGDGGPSWEIGWASSTAPPVTGPFDFVAYRTGSCTAWSTLLTYVLRSVGVPARQVGTPCWNSALGGVNFTGLAIHNPNVSKCWHGGEKAGGKMVYGNDFLNNHNWVELYDAQKGTWVHVNVPPSSGVPNTGLCSFDEATGCDYNATTGCRDAGKLGQAMWDHPIFSPTWSLSGDLPGEEVVDAAHLTLSSGEPVSPLVWASNLSNVFGEPLSHDGLRMLNLTSKYRCHKPSPRQ